MVPEIRPMGTTDKPWHLNLTTDGGLFQAPSSVTSRCGCGGGFANEMFHLIFAVLTCMKKSDIT